MGFNCDIYYYYYYLINFVVEKTVVIDLNSSSCSRSRYSVRVARYKAHTTLYYVHYVYRVTETYCYKDNGNPTCPIRYFQYVCNRYFGHPTHADETTFLRLRAAVENDKTQNDKNSRATVQYDCYAKCCLRVSYSFASRVGNLIAPSSQTPSSVSSSPVGDGCSQCIA